MLAGVRAGTADGLFPPVLTMADEGVLTVERRLGGAADAELLAAAFRESRFAPMLRLLVEVDAWCASTGPRHARTVEPGVLAVTNARLFGPLVAQAFTACAAGGASTGERFARNAARYTAFLDLFLDRLRSDVETSWFGDPSLSPPVTGLTAWGAESHNGGQRVLELRMAGGGRVAYKPRPAGGEALFLSDGDPDGDSDIEPAAPPSVFALLNSLPAASGPVTLPLLSCRTGNRPDHWAYSWHEWIGRPAQWGVIRRSPRLALRGTRLGRAAGERFWRRTGSLAAASFAFGISDLGEGNLLAGTTARHSEPLFFPVDLEIHRAPVRRLRDTGLVADPAGGGNHHPGLEDAPRWCTVDGPTAYFETGPAGTLRLRCRSAPCARATTRSVVADTDGNSGYARYLPAFLRGMFDAWTLICRHRGHVARYLADRSAGRFVRVLLRETAAYTDVLDAHLLGTAVGTGGFSPAEHAQLDRLDVPYFFRRPGIGTLLTMSPPPACDTTPVPDRPATDGEPLVTAGPNGQRLTLAGLGIPIRDAVEYAFATTGAGEWIAAALGVELRIDDAHHGEVRFTWPEAARQFTYVWREETVRLHVDPLPDPPPAADDGIRRRLLRLDRVDAALRAAWVASGFTDAATEEKLRRLTGTGLNWLEGIVTDHGWPGRRLVGARAAAAACRLVQHSEGNREFRWECLRLARRAAAVDDLSWRQVAYLTDSLRMGDGRSQLYGTKFRLVDGGLEPCPIQWPEHVDDRRRLLGMEPLNRYATRLRQRYRIPADAETPCPTPD